MSFAVSKMSFILIRVKKVYCTKTFTGTYKNEFYIVTCIYVCVVDMLAILAFNIYFKPAKLASFSKTKASLWQMGTTQH